MSKRVLMHTRTSGADKHMEATSVCCETCRRPSAGVKASTGGVALLILARATCCSFDTVATAAYLSTQSDNIRRGSRAIGKGMHYRVW